MRSLVWLIVGAWLVSAPAYADDMMLLGVGGRSGAAPYVGPGDVVALSFWVGMRAYNTATRGTAAVNICSESAGVDVTCEDELTSATTGKLVLGTVGSTCSSVTCTVKIWYDPTGNNFCGASTPCNFTQTTVANRATFLITGCPGTSGQPCASFNGSSDCYASPGTSTASQPYSQTAVAERNPSSSNPQSIFIFANTTGQIGFSSSANSMLMYDGSVISAAATDATLHAVQAAFDGTASSGSTLDIDGTPTTGTMAGAPGTLPGLLGSIHTACDNQQLQGYFVEMGFKSSLFSSGDMSALTSNQRTFWGF